MSNIKTRAAQLALEKHRLETETYSVDFASGASPRLSSSETVATGSARVIKVVGSTQTDVTNEFATGAPIAVAVATGAQAASKVTFTLAAATTGAQDADAEYYVRVMATAGSRDMVSLHKLIVFELGDVAAP